MIRPLHDRVFVRRVEEKAMTDGGLYIPDKAKEKPNRGVVVARGEGRRDKDGQRVALDVQEGDEILFPKFHGVEIRIDDVEHVVLREDEILAVVKRANG